MTDRLDTLRALANKGVCALTGAAPVVTRLVLGQLLFFSGHGKLEHLADTVTNFVGWGVPMPGLIAPATATVELVGGLMLFVGLGTRVAALLLIGVLCGALSTAHAGQLSHAWRIWDSSEEVPLLDDIAALPPLAFLLWIAAYGPGWLSLDRLVTRWWPAWRLGGAPASPPQPG
jgi:putative oxidoreductase